MVAHWSAAISLTASTELWFTSNMDHNSTSPLQRTLCPDSILNLSTPPTILWLHPFFSDSSHYSMVLSSLLWLYYHISHSTSTSLHMTLTYTTYFQVYRSTNITHLLHQWHQCLGDPTNRADDNWHDCSPLSPSPTSLRLSHYCDLWSNGTKTYYWLQ